MPLGSEVDTSLRLLLGPVWWRWWCFFWPAGSEGRPLVVVWGAAPRLPPAPQLAAPQRAAVLAAHPSTSYAPLTGLAVVDCLGDGGHAIDRHHHIDLLHGVSGWVGGWVGVMRRGALA